MNKFKKITSFFNRWLTPILSFTILICGFLASYDFNAFQKSYPNWHHQLVLAKDWSFWIFILSSIIQLSLTVIYNIFCQPTIYELESKLHLANSKNASVLERLKDLFYGYLSIFADNKLKFGLKNDKTERISLYIYNGNNFNLIVRYSKNPKFKSPGKGIYPVDQGCLGKAWEHDWHFDDKFPCPKNKKTEYEDYSNKKYLLPKKVSKALNMQSRLYAALRIDGHDKKPLAIIVVESINEKRYKESEIKALLKEQKEPLSHLIETWKNDLPSLDEAKSKGL